MFSTICFYSLRLTRIFYKNDETPTDTSLRTVATPQARCPSRHLADALTPPLQTSGRQKYLGAELGAINHVNMQFMKLLW